MTRVIATLRNIDPQDISRTRVDLRWRFELTTISDRQFFRKYPDERKAAEPKVSRDDYLE